MLSYLVRLLNNRRARVSAPSKCGVAGQQATRDEPVLAQFVISIRLFHCLTDGTIVDPGKFHITEHLKRKGELGI
jgi:hypothetical protein